MNYFHSRQPNTSGGRTESPRPAAVTGSSLLLVVFLVMCLVTFAALCLSTAKSDYAYSSRLAERRHAYYAACNEANRLAAEIDEKLARGGSEADLTGLAERDGDRITYSVPINEKQSLRVELTAGESGAELKVTAWQVVTEAGEAGALNLMKPEEN